MHIPKLVHHHPYLSFKFMQALLNISNGNTKVQECRHADYCIRGFTSIDVTLVTWLRPIFTNVLIFLSGTVLGPVLVYCSFYEAGNILILVFYVVCLGYVYESFVVIHNLPFVCLGEMAIKVSFFLSIGMPSPGRP